MVLGEATISRELEVELAHGAIRYHYPCSALCLSFAKLRDDFVSPLGKEARKTKKFLDLKAFFPFLLWHNLCGSIYPLS